MKNSPQCFPPVAILLTLLLCLTLAYSTSGCGKKNKSSGTPIDLPNIAP